MPPAADLTKRYSTSENLAARGRLHRDYSVSDTGWFEWVAERLPLSEGSGVLDIGCGPGWFWATGSAGELPEEIELTLADSSPGMVQEAVGRCKPLRHWEVTGREAN